MAKLFGIYCPSGLTQQYDFIVEKLKLEDENSGDGQFNDVHDDNIYMASLDYQTFGVSAFLQSDSQIAMLVGHPLMTSNRVRDLDTLNKDFTDKTLRQCDGVFCMARFNKHNNCLDIATDALGGRPFYYVYYEGAFIFSTQFSLLTKLGLPLTCNQEGMMEYATLGYYLFDHTHYQEISCILPGHRIQASSLGVRKTQYFDWCKLAKEGEYYEGALEGLKRDLDKNVDKYLGKDHHVLTTLSGGLDSRLIACMLKRRNIDITALHFSEDLTQDAYCAKSFADSQNIHFNIIDIEEESECTVEDLLGKYWRNGSHPDYYRVNRSGLAWSGNGGSVGLGLIYYSEHVYQAALTQDVEHLADAYLAQQYAFIPKSIIRGAANMQAALKENVMRSLNQFGDMPLDKAYYLFLLLNSQHHFSAIPSEKVDEYQMDFCMPFFSWKILRHVISQPISRLRKHRFYHDFLQYAFPEAFNTPWQAYPDHLPCTLTQGFKAQWHEKKQKPCNSAHAYALLFSLMFSQHKQMVNLPSLSAVTILHSLGIKAYNDKFKVIEHILRW